MRSVATLFVVAVLTACGAGEQQVPEVMGPTLADFAGTWQMTAMLEGTPDPVPSTMMGMASPDGWTLSLEGRPNIPLTVNVVGDSLITQSAEYESVLRAGVMVSIRVASALDNGMLTGRMVATYTTEGGMQEVPGTIHGMRAPM